MKLRSYCVAVKCPNRSVEGSLRCEAHRVKHASAPKSAPQAYGYDRRWYAISIRVRNEVGYCELCLKTDDLTVDHIVPMSRGGTSDRENLRVLCRSCHGRRRHEGPTDAQTTMQHYQ